MQQARELVQQVEAESRFGILQLSRTYEITPEVAAAVAEFRGEMLILGIKSLSPEVAAALAKSQAANVWLHSVTSVSPEAAEAIVKLRGHLFLTVWRNSIRCRWQRNLPPGRGPCRFLT